MAVRPYARRLHLLVFALLRLVTEHAPDAEGAVELGLALRLGADAVVHGEKSVTVRARQDSSADVAWRGVFIEGSVGLTRADREPLLCR